MVKFYYQVLKTNNPLFCITKVISKINYTNHPLKHYLGKLIDMMVLIKRKSSPMSYLVAVLINNALNQNSIDFNQALKVKASTY